MEQTWNTSKINPQTVLGNLDRLERKEIYQSEAHISMQGYIQ